MKVTEFIYKDIQITLEEGPDNYNLTVFKDNEKKLDREYTNLPEALDAWHQEVEGAMAWNQKRETS